MSVVSRNPFALLDEDSSRPSSPVPVAAAPAPAPAAPQKAKSTGPASRGGKYYARGGAKAGSGNPNQTGVDEIAVESQRKFEGGRGVRGGARGRGGPRGGNGRQFDKHSQTGKTDSDKKVHQSWGGDEGKSELKAENAGLNDAAAEGQDWAGNATSGGDWGAAATDAAPEAAPVEGAKSREDRSPRREREPEEEDNTLTLEQYLAQKKENDIVPKLEGPRQVDSAIWKDAQVLKAEPEADYFAGKGKTTKAPRAKKDEKVFLEIDARFERPSRGGDRGRGGRGGDRGDRRGGNNNRGARGGQTRGPARPAAAAVDVADEAAFPSLA